MMNGDGFAVLADTALEKPCILLHKAANPRMDLVALLSQDAASATVSSGPQAPPGMSAAQFALLQRMLARQRGTKPATSAGPPEPQRGPTVSLSLWKVGDESSVVWTTPLAVDKLADLPTQEQEHEDMVVQDVVWSPEGDRFAVLFTLRRSPSTPTSSTAVIRIATYVKTFSVHDGRLLSTQKLAAVSSEDLDDRMTISWTPILFPADAPPLTQSQLLLRKLRPLPPLPAADTFAGAAQGALMPHQIRMMQMSGKSPPPSFVYPSTLAIQGRGPLAAIPCLVTSATTVESAIPASMMAVTRPSQTALLLDGVCPIGTVPIRSASIDTAQTVVLTPDMSAHYHLELSPSDKGRLHAAQLPIAKSGSYGPDCALRRSTLTTRTAHLVRAYLGYSIDSIAAVREIYTRDWTAKVTAEWDKHLLDAEQKFGADIEYELLCVLLTGRAGEAVDHLLLATLTEGVLTRLEQQFQAATNSIKRILAYSTTPALQRTIICVQDLVGIVRFFSRTADSQHFDTLLRDLQSTLASVLDLARLVDEEAINMQEFWRWCRVERERQERIKQDQDEPRLPITYDVLTVSRLIHRGFTNTSIDHILSLAPRVPPKADPMTLSLEQVLEQAKAHLAAPEAHLMEKLDEEQDTPVALLPMLEHVAAAIGDAIHSMLAMTFETVDAQIVAELDPIGPLLSEPSAAIKSLVSAAVDVEPAQHVLVRTVSTALETLVAVVQRDDVSRITVHRFAHTPTPAVETTTMTIATGLDDEAALIDMAFFGAYELLLLTQTHLYAIPISQQTTGPVAPTRVIELSVESEKKASLAVNENKQTVTVLLPNGAAQKLLYLDLSLLPEQEAGSDMLQD